MAHLRATVVGVPADWAGRFRGRATVAVTAGVAALTLTAWPRVSEAHSCIDHVAETFDLELLGVFNGTSPANAPEMVRQLDRLTNSAQKGLSVLVFRKSDWAFGKFYRLTSERQATPEVQKSIDEMRRLRMKIRCGGSVPYTPIVPGEYAFDQEHDTGARQSVGIGSPLLTVSTDRKQVELTFTFANERLRAIYKVKRSYFD